MMRFGEEKGDGVGGQSVRNNEVSISPVGFELVRGEAG